MDFVPDTSHGVHNGVLEAINEVGLKGHAYLKMMAVNTPHGPWSEDTRFVQCQNVMEEILKFERPDKAVLFQELLPSILADRDEEWRIGEAGISESVWEDLRHSSPWVRKGKKVNSS
eukprot:12400906-Heterocapsa_arctica.AAC.1